MIPMPQVSFEEYLETEEESTVKQEYLHCTVYAIAGGSRFHSFIGGNCSSLLRNQLRGRGCQVFNSDQKLETPAREASFYPDVSVACAGKLLPGGKPLQNPVLVIEVLSRSMSNYDLKTKLGQYQRLASLRQMLFVDSEEVCVQIYWRGDGEVWPGAPILYAEWSDTVELPALGIAMSLETIYEDVDFSLVGG